MHFQRVDETTICSEIAQTCLDDTPSIELMKQELFLTIPLKQSVFVALQKLVVLEGALQSFLYWLERKADEGPAG